MIITYELKKALFNILSTDQGLSDLGITGVHSKVPDNSNYPYLRIDGIVALEFDSHTDTGFSGSFIIKTFNTGDSDAKMINIQSRVYEILHRAEIQTDNFKSVMINCKNTTHNFENDSRTQGGTQNFDFIFSRSDNLNI